MSESAAIEPLGPNESFEISNFVLNRLEEETSLSDAEVLEEQELIGRDWFAEAGATKAALLKALPAAHLRVRAEAQLMAYKRFRPLLLFALSKLSAIGIRCPPVKGVRLIRAFFDAQPMREHWVASQVIDDFLSFAHERSAFFSGGAR